MARVIAALAGDRQGEGPGVQAIADVERGADGVGAVALVIGPQNPKTPWTILSTEFTRGINKIEMNLAKRPKAVTCYIW